MIDTKTTLITTTKATVIAKNHGDYYYKSVIQYNMISPSSLKRSLHDGRGVGLALLLWRI